jgi:hypothetical protein
MEINSNFVERVDYLWRSNSNKRKKKTQTKIRILFEKFICLFKLRVWIRCIELKRQTLLFYFSKFEKKH